MESVVVRHQPRHLIRIVVILAASLALLATGIQTSSALDVYTTPGKHSHNGRTWLTSCEKYSSKVDRCTTRIWGTTVTHSAGKFTVKNAWAFNNLTYKSTSRSTWELWNPLVTPGEHTVAGRKWRTECDTSWTGYNGCRSQIWATVPEYRSGRYQMVNKWVFNNIVHVTPVKCPVSQASVRKVLKQPSAVTADCLVSATNGTWAATQSVIQPKSGNTYVETAFFQQAKGLWYLKARGNSSSASICNWWKSAHPPLDLADSISYCFER